MPNTGPEPQNIYDDERFFAGYSGMDRFGTRWRRAVEHLDLLQLVGAAAGRRVLDLGCGAGQLSRHLAESGAAEVTAVDVSERMLAVARSESFHPRVRYLRAAIEEIDFPAMRFELVVSSLAFHYLQDYAGLVRRIAAWLTAGGTLVFSTEHPIYTARLPHGGWVTDATGRRTGWMLDDYAGEGAREEEWFVTGVRKYHRRLSSLIEGVLAADLQLERVIEPVPTEAWLRDHPGSEDERRRPMFLLLRARKPGVQNGPSF